MEIIIAKQENIVECNLCGNHSVKNETGILDTEILKMYINKACPVCGNNLCTVDEYLKVKSLEKTIKRVNKWFGWLSFFYKKENIII